MVIGTTTGNNRAEKFKSVFSLSKYLLCCNSPWRSGMHEKCQQWSFCSHRQIVSTFPSRRYWFQCFRKGKKATCPGGGQLTEDRIIDSSILQIAFTIDNMPIFSHMQLEIFISHAEELAGFYKW